MTIDTSESQFEKNIESHLLNNGYIQGFPKDFNKKYVIDNELFFQFIQDTQKEKWEKLQEIHGENIKEKILQSYQKEIDSDCLIHVIRKGFTVSKIKIDCMFLKPEHGMNPEFKLLYSKNLFSVTRQVITSENNKPDIVLFLNGIPIITAELKNPATNQSFEDAITQYKKDRDPKDKLFSFKRGALVHFAVDPFQVHMTTKLQKEETRFLPFNKGRDHEQGNPDNPKGFPTSYLWEDIWQKDMFIEIISNFIELQILPQKSPIPDKEVLIFPRYHQLDAVLRLTDDTKQNGVGTNYLIQHSPGSGKSNTIAWLAYKLLRLFDKQDKPVFDGILIISDRNVVVNQLGDTVEQFEQTSGTSDTAEKSKQLAKTLSTDRKITTTTQQKFPFVLEYISKVKGKNFAVIIDEAHSSQTPNSRQKIQHVLTTNLEESEKQQEQIESQQLDITNSIEKEISARGPQNTISYYAFTATPKEDTLKLFGVPVEGQKSSPFHTYSMRQAIQEGFILNVLENYSTYESQFKIVQTCSENKTVDGKKAKQALQKYVDSHYLNIPKKSKIIVEHFRDHTRLKIGEKAKAMVVCSSRNAAFNYKTEIDEYIEKHNYKKIKTMIAFSGELKDELGNIFTENSLNHTKSDKEFREKFNSREYNILIVAEKYQTGFDQPLLHTMYVDKKLRGIKAVQTLSRLNRPDDGKTDTFVMDFKNNVDEIFNAFNPYYEQTSLVDNTNPQYLSNLYNMLMEFEIILPVDLDNFAKIFYKLRSEQTEEDYSKLIHSISPISTRFTDIDEKIQDDFRVKIKKYLECYLFMSQIIRYDNTNFEKLSGLLRFIITQPTFVKSGSKLPNFQGDISLQWYRLEKTYDGKILLGQAEDLNINRNFGRSKPPDVLTTLSEVIYSLNQSFGGLADADTITLTKWFEEIKKDETLHQIAQENPFDDFFVQFKKKFMLLIIEYDIDDTLAQRIYTDTSLQNKLVDGASQVYHEWAQITKIKVN
jgi:type I restriction enzyme, R subunit